jgi:putative phage-type endonuclease
MKIVDCEQGSPEWHAARCGRVTASRVADIMRKTKSGVSASRNTYMGELIAERLSGFQDAYGFTSKAMDWGKEQEPRARAMYGFMRDVTPALVGLVIHPTIEMAAGSPDSLIADDGMLEIKCPNSATHIATLLGAPIDPDYVKQMQWNMACTGAKWCDFVSFDPRMPGHMQVHIERVSRDAIAIVEMQSAVLAFLAEMDARLADLVRRYPEPTAADAA